MPGLRIKTVGCNCSYASQLRASDSTVRIVHALLFGSISRVLPSSKRRRTASMAPHKHSGRTCVLFFLLLSVSLVLGARSVRRSEDISSVGDARFWQRVLNKTLSGNVDQAFGMVFSRVSDDLASAVNRIGTFLDGVRRNVTTVVRDSPILSAFNTNNAPPKVRK